MRVDEHLRVDVRREGNRAVLELHGELDLVGAPLLQAEVENPEINGSTMVILDLQDLRFIDSAGLRVILAAHERSQRLGQAFALTRGSQQVQRLLSIAGVSEHLRIVESADEMLV